MKNLLTGNCLKAFEVWYNNNYGHYTKYVDFYKNESYFDFVSFKQHDYTVQTAIIKNFLDSVNIYVIVEPYRYETVTLFKINVLGCEVIENQTSYTKREHANFDAVRKANNIYNTNTIEKTP